MEWLHKRLTDLIIYECLYLYHSQSIRQDKYNIIVATDSSSLESHCHIQNGIPKNSHSENSEILGDSENENPLLPPTSVA